MESLKARLDETLGTLNAIRNGEVDALVVSTYDGDKVFTLRGAEHPYRIMVEAMSEGAVTMSQDGIIVYCNRRFAEIVQEPLEKVIGSSIRRFIDPEGIHLFDALFEKGKRGNVKSEFNLKAGTGTVIPVLLSAGVLQKSDSMGALCMVISDLTEQKRSEEIVASERLANLILNQAAEAFLVCNEKGEIIRASREAHLLAKGNPLFRKFDETYCLSRREKGRRVQTFGIRDILDGSTIRMAEFTLEEKNGHGRGVLLSAAPLKSGSDIVGCVAVMMDITERTKIEKALSKSETDLRRAEGLAKTGYWERDIASERMKWSDGAYGIYGLEDRKQLLMYSDFLARVHPADRADIDSKIRQAEKNLNGYGLAYRIVRPDGAIRFVQAWGDISRDRHGKAVHVFGTIQDITDLKQMEDALRMSEKKYRDVVEMLPLFIFEMDEKGVVTFANQHAIEFMGYCSEDLGKICYTDLLIPREHERAKEVMERLMSGKASNGVEFTAVRKDGSTFPVITYACPVMLGGNFIGLRGAVADISQRKRMEEEIKRSSDRLRSLAAHQEKIREDERSRVALEIHDELGQVLTCMKMDIAWLLRKLPEGQDGLEKKLQGLSQAMDESIHLIRRISTGLRPPVLDDFGLSAAIEWQAKDFQAKTGIFCALALQDVNMNGSGAISVFRIFQESLTNTARHANATAVWIQLFRKNGSIIMQIRDNGCGIKGNDARSGRSLGIAGMKERAILLKGQLNITGAPGEGTTVTLTIPDSEQAIS